jgi:membrane protein
LYPNPEIHQEDIWKTSPEQHSRGRYFLIRQVKIFFIAFREFFDKKIQMRASALTYYTLLSVVPVVAMVLELQRVGLEQRLETEITSHLKGQEKLYPDYQFCTKPSAECQRRNYRRVGMVILFWSVIERTEQY